MEHLEPLEQGQKFGIVGEHVANAAHQGLSDRAPVVAVMRCVVTQRLRHGVNIADLTTFIFRNIAAHNASYRR